MILDYNDFVAAGTITGVPIESANPVYAINIKMASDELIGKFDISDKYATEKSIIALGMQKELNDDTRDKIAYFLNQAAINHGLTTVQTKTASLFHDNIIDMDKVFRPVTKEIITLKIAEREYPLRDELNIKEASEKLLLNLNLTPFMATYKAANALLAASVRNNLPMSAKISKLAHPKIGTMAHDVINLRKKMFPEHTEMLSKMANLIGDISPITLVDMVRQFDMATDFNSAKFGQDFFSIMEDTYKKTNYVDDLPKKVAECALPTKESVDFLNAIT